MFFFSLFWFSGDKVTGSQPKVLLLLFSLLFFKEKFHGETILGDPGADSGGEGKSKRAGKYGTKKSKERREERTKKLIKTVFQKRDSVPPLSTSPLGDSCTRPMLGNSDSGICVIFSSFFGMWNPGLWTPELSSRKPESY